MFSELEERRLRKTLDDWLKEHRPPPDIRHQLDLVYRIEGQNVELIEVRPDWRNPEEKIETPVAKMTRVKRSELWKLYWQRADLKWHRYDPLPEADTLEACLAEIAQDPYGCFFG